MKRKNLFFILAFCVLLSACGTSTASKWQEQYDLGVRYLTEGNYEEAIIAFTAAIEIDPKKAEAYVGLARAYIGTGDEAAAVEWLLKGLEAADDASEIAKLLAELGVEVPEELAQASGAAGGEAQTAQSGAQNGEWNRWIHKLDQPSTLYAQLLDTNGDGEDEMITLNHMTNAGVTFFEVFFPAFVDSNKSAAEFSYDVQGEAFGLYRNANYENLFVGDYWEYHFEQSDNTTDVDRYWYFAEISLPTDRDTIRFGCRTSEGMRSYYRYDRAVDFETVENKSDMTADEWQAMLDEFVLVEKLPFTRDELVASGRTTSVDEVREELLRRMGKG